MPEKVWNLTRRLTIRGDLCRRTGASVDSRLLAALVQATPGERLAELGAGCAAASLVVADRSPGVLVDALELQPVLVQLARENIQRNNLAATIQPWAGDVRRPPPVISSGSYHQVFFNPPYFRPGEGRLSPDPVRSQARCEMTATLQDFVLCAADLLCPGGQCHVVHRPERWAEMAATLAHNGLTPWRLFRVHPRPNHPVALILVTACKTTPHHTIPPLLDTPLFLDGASGEESLSQQLFAGRPLGDTTRLFPF
ncbi:MAG: methyltransferase [Magnetococcales bacterium]|nr:methyltransferase [Magnetococcales bacterium]MBF0322692.1 methyltransferase [Magnetococcales bacterium]